MASENAAPFIGENGKAGPGLREEKLISEAEIGDFVADGDLVAVGGSMFQNKPIALIRSLIRARRRDLRMIGVPQASLDIDLLIAAGSVKQVMAAYLGFDHLGLAPAYRRAGRSGAVSSISIDETQLLAGLDAAASDSPFAISRTGVGTDLVKANPYLELIDCPFTQEKAVAVARIAPDVALVQADEADCYGNLRYAGFKFADQELVNATKRGGGKVIAAVNSLASHESFTNSPYSTGIASFQVDAVVVTPFSAYPCACHGAYSEDVAELKRYLRMAAEDGLEEYVQAEVMPFATQDAYLEALKPNLTSLLIDGKEPAWN